MSVLRPLFGNGRAERQRAHHTTDRGIFVPLVFGTGARRSSSTGAKTGPIWAENASSCRLLHIKLSHSRAFLILGLFSADT